MQHTMRRFCTHLTSFTLLFSFCALTGWSAEGLQVKIEKVVINSELKAEVTFTMQDDAGMPLAVETVRPSFMIAVLNVLDANTGSARYFSYTTRKSTVPAGYPNAGASTDQATTDSGGTFKQLGPGKYVYTFKTALPAGYDMTKTHTVSGQVTYLGSSGTRYKANPLYHFVPDGSPVTALRKVTTTEACNKCHVSMGFHGSGGRMEVGFCILCHQPQTIDPDTGNSVDMTEMIHKIHMSVDLPSVKAGKPYQIVGHNQSLHDYSNIHFPQDVRNCQVCHTGEQGDLFKKAPSRQACGSCHDDINFDTGAGHMNLPQPDDSMCAICHQPEGEEFSAAIDGAHTVPRYSKKLKGLIAEVVDVINAAPGQKPTVRFTIKENDGTVLDPAVIIAAKGSLGISYAGPSADYKYYQREALSATSAELLDGAYAYTFGKALPADATGTIAVSIEARRPVVLVDNPEGTADLSVTEGAFNPIKLVAIDGLAPVERRKSVDLAKCNDCHGGTLALHGGQRFALEFCVFCHNPNVSDIARRKDAAGNNLPGGESISFDHMVHKIHTGSHLEGDYTVYGYGNTPHPYKELVHYPGLRQNCTSCHTAMPALPVAAAKQPINFVDNDGQVVLVPPTTASCTGCHDAREVRAHASLNVTIGGIESCAVCHKAGRNASILEAHVVRIKNNVIETVASDSTPIDQWQVFGEE